MKYLRKIEILCAVGLTLVLGAGLAAADDRVLLRAEGAPANVLVIMDSGASMTHDPLTNSMQLLAAGDDQGQYVDYMEHVYGTSYLESVLGSNWPVVLSQGAKMPQAKSALRTFFNAGFDFNFGFTYYEKTLIATHYLNYIYRVLPDADLDGDGVAETPQNPMLDETPVWGPIRMGHDVAARGTDPEMYPIRYGIDGTDTYTLWDIGPRIYTPGSGDRRIFYGNWSDEEPSSHAAGDRRVVSELVTTNNPGTAVSWAALTALQRMAGKYFYYPAWDWNEVSGVIQNGLTGSTTWETIATGLGLNTTDPWGPWLKQIHDAAILDIETRSDGTSNQIGSEILHVRETLQVYDGSSWTTSQTQITDLGWVQEYITYDHDPADENPTDTFSAIDYQGTADCAGYISSNNQGQSMIPISQPDPASGATKDQRWLINSYLGPQTDPTFYFPNNVNLYLPPNRESYLPMTETMSAIGRRPIKDSINEAKAYFDGTIDDWNDPLANCRMNFVLLITDGLETCSNLTAPCSAAANIAPTPVYVIYFGTDENALNPDLSAVSCVADESGGLFFSAGNEQEMIAALMQIAMDIEERTRGFASPIVPSVQSSSEQMAYISTFTPKDGRSIWRGHLRAYPIDPLTGLLTGLRVDGTPDPTAAYWDAGDTLALRPANSRKMYFGVPTASTDIPGETVPFIYQSGSTTDEEFSRWWLGEKIFYPDSWLVNNPLNPSGPQIEDPTGAKQQALQNVINFTRGVTMERDTVDPDIVTVWGRDPNRYGWCSATGDEEDGDPEPCASDGAVYRGVEKLGDIFHSTPQLLGAPKCFTCWFQNQWKYRDDLLTDADPNDGYYGKNERRRQVIFTGADDGALHAFDAGMWDPDGDTVDGETIDPTYDKGTGRELFAWVPNATMNTLDVLAFGADHRWTVDATPTVADVYIDPEFTGAPTAAEREWRTVVLFGQRRGGRSYVALDVTNPDPLDSDGIPLSPAIGDVTITPWTAAQDTARDVVCVNGTESGCTRRWPEFRWEFEDLDAYETARNEDYAAGNLAPDLGQSWSRPLVGFLRVDTDNDTNTPAEAKMVAFFGGGYAHDGLYTLDPSGNFVYGIDIETGEILFKVQSAGMVPSSVSAIDANLDGFLEMIYWGDTAGYLYHMDLSVDGIFGNVTINAAGDTEVRVINWAPEVIFKAGAAGDGVGQPFFQQPTLVPVAFQDDGTAIVAVAIGSGNRDNIMEANAIAHRFYVVVDTPKADGTVITEADMDGFNHNTVAAADANFLATGSFGWYLEFFDSANVGENWEKVNTPALILQSMVIFSTFNPSSDIQEVPIRDEDGDIIGYACRRGGNARTYVVNLTNGNAPDGGDRFIQHDSATAMVTEPVVYLGADGEIHVIQAKDNLAMAEPIASFGAKMRALNWKEH